MLYTTRRAPYPSPGDANDTPERLRDLAQWADRQVNPYAAAGPVANLPRIGLHSLAGTDQGRLHFSAIYLEAGTDVHALRIAVDEHGHTITTLWLALYSPSGSSVARAATGFTASGEEVSGLNAGVRATSAKLAAGGVTVTASGVWYVAAAAFGTSITEGGDAPIRYLGREGDRRMDEISPRLAGVWLGATVTASPSSAPATVDLAATSSWGPAGIAYVEAVL